MLCCNQTTEQREAVNRSKQIEKSLKHDGDKSQKEVKLLLLGKLITVHDNSDP